MERKDMEIQHEFSHLPEQIPFVLNTRDSSQTTPWYATWQNQHFLTDHMHQNVHLLMDGIIFPNLVYPINKYNNNISFEEASAVGTILSATIPENNYTGFTLAVALKTIMDAAGTDTYTVTYDSQAEKLNFVSTGTFRFTQEPSNGAYEELGITTSSSYSGNITGDYPINISGSQYVDVISNLSSNSYSSTHESTNVIMRVPLVTGFGSVIHFGYDNKHKVLLTNPSFNTILFELRDDKGNAWELPTNASVSYHITVLSKRR